MAARPPMTSSGLRRSLLGVGLLALFAFEPGLVWAQAGKKAAAPTAPRVSPTLAEVQRTLAAAQDELESLKRDAAREAEALGSRVEEETKEAAQLRQEERDVFSRLRSTDAELARLDAELAKTEEERTRADEALGQFKGELESQEGGFLERFQGTLIGVEDPQLFETVKKSHDSKSSDFKARIQTLVSAYEKVLTAARAVSRGEVPVELAHEGGKIEKVEALRVGLLAGYYSRKQGAEAGFILSDDEGKSGFKALHDGVSSQQQAEISRIVADPARGGLLPWDVSGGAGVAVLRTRDTVSRWFELGGWAMWPLLAVALCSVLLILERSIVLSLLSLRVQRGMKRILGLIRGGRTDQAEAVAQRSTRAVAGVVHAAVAHAELGKAAMEDAVQEALLHHSPSFQARLSFLSLCAAISPLLGLLGTVTGMITTFKMVTLFGTSDPRTMAGGISEALITTEAGLIIAIPTLLMRGILGAVAEAGLGKLETGALSIVMALARREDSDSPAEVAEVGL